jgi:hypothetical protein
MPNACVRPNIAELDASKKSTLAFSSTDAEGVEVQYADWGPFILKEPTIHLRFKLL